MIEERTIDWTRTWKELTATLLILLGSLTVLAIASNLFGRLGDFIDAPTLVLLFFGIAAIGIGVFLLSQASPRLPRSNPSSTHGPQDQEQREGNVSLPTGLQIAPQTNTQSPSSASFETPAPSLDKQVRPWAILGQSPRSHPVRLRFRRHDGFYFPSTEHWDTSAPACRVNLLILLTYVFVEPTVLCVWGTTPGKSLLRITLRKTDGTDFSYTDALTRSFKVYVRGLALGIPAVTFITQLVAFDRLRNRGVTSWDEEGNFTVNHADALGWRLPVAALVVVVCILFSAAKLP